MKKVEIALSYKISDEAIDKNNTFYKKQLFKEHQLKQTARIVLNDNCKVQ